ncbi:MAG: HlyC/CorC family transporter [Actinobacteria bacterium]|nr:HlyC/CorC family transporter [Actinomycetota bacterium]
MSSTDVLMFAIAIVLVFFASFLAMAETSITRMSRHKATVLADEGKTGAKELLRITEHPENYLNPVLLVVLASHLAVATLVGLVAEQAFGTWGVLLGVVFEVGFLFVVGEAAPKTWAVLNSERAALLVARPVVMIGNFAPLRWVARGLIGVSNALLPGKGLKQGPYVSEEELLAMTDAAADDDVIEQEERQLIRSVFEFGDTVAREVMVPRPDMLAVEGSQKVTDVIDTAMKAGFSRIPVYDENIDNVVGVVFTKDLLRAEREGKADTPVRNLAREGLFVPESKPVAELMREMQRKKLHLAFVLDEFGDTAGIVTLEDLIEELVGEINDEYDVEEAPVERLPNGEVRVNGKMPIDEVNDLLGIALPEGDDWDTIAGLLFNRLGHVPVDGEQVMVAAHTLTAERVQGRRIGRVRLKVGSMPNDKADSAE